MTLSSEPIADPRLPRLETGFVDALNTLAQARPFAKALHQNSVFGLALRILKVPGGVELMYRHAGRFDEAGLFYGSDWDSPSTLLASLTPAAYHAKGLSLAVESLSELRMLAIALGDAVNDTVPAADARRFVEEVLGQNLDLLFPDSTETTRITRETAPELMAGVQRLFEFMLESLGPAGIIARVVEEAERILSQRPILVRRVKSIIAAATGSSLHAPDTDAARRLQLLRNAAEGPTDLSREHGHEAWARVVRELPLEALASEATAMGTAMWASGLVSPQHAVLLRYLAETRRSALIADALGLATVGRASLEYYRELVCRLIEIAIHPATAQSAYGLACLLVTGVLFVPPVAPGLRRLIGMSIAPNVADDLRGLMQHATPSLPTPEAHSILLAGAISVLGQPLGVGQGDNPTCQSARAISLWAQADAGFLLEATAWAARDNRVSVVFEGDELHSDELPEGMAPVLCQNLDPVSKVLVPHLDRIYAEMSRRVVGRGEDGHKWINREFHGWWVNAGFAIAVDVKTNAIAAFEDFVRLFFASYHPDYRNEAEQVYPQPAGVASTDSNGEFLGWHAISIQRIARDVNGVVRAYFYNPNNDGRQFWGQDIVTSVVGNGEMAGESSLPFNQFCARLYLFHYNVREHGDPAAAPAEDVAEITELVQESWGVGFPWQDEMSSGEEALSDDDEEEES